MPRRRCVGCGRIASKSELVRLAVAGPGDERPRRAVIDPAGTLPGRGAYLCRLEDGAAGPRAAGRNGDLRHGRVSPGYGRAPLLQADTAEAKPNPDCLRLAERRRGIARTLRCAVTLAPEIVESAKRVAQPAEGRRAGPLAIPKS